MGASRFPAAKQTRKGLNKAKTDSRRNLIQNLVARPSSEAVASEEEVDKASLGGIAIVGREDLGEWKRVLIGLEVNKRISCSVQTGEKAIIKGKCCSYGPFLPTHRFETLWEQATTRDSPFLSFFFFSLLNMWNWIYIYIFPVQFTVHAGIGLERKKSGV